MEMAMEKIRRIIYCCFLLGILLVGDVSARRGGGGSRSSGSRGRSRGSAGSVGRSYSSHRSPVLTGRIVSGSSIYTRSNWRTAAMAGFIFGGPMYIRRYPHRHDMPPICTNNYEKTPEGKVLGYFICPGENHTDDFIYCCGGERREYCCNMTMAIEFSSRYKKSETLSVGAIVGIALAVCVVIGVCIYCCRKRKHPGFILGHFSPKDAAKHRDNDSSAPFAPLNQPGHHINGLTPTVPPPSYDAATSKIGHGAGDALPYGPPQPQPPPGYDEKSGFPPSDIGSAPQPYWAPYPEGELPYPLPPAAPYPPPGGPPYPSQGTDPNLPREGAPYPSVSSTPYPVPDSTTYPAPGYAPYPLPHSVPYPVSTDAPYPDTASAPYPSSADAAPYPLTGSAPYFSEGSAPYPAPSGASHGGYPAPGTGGVANYASAPK